jgi:hypothetical protein
VLDAQGKLVLRGSVHGQGVHAFAAAQDAEVASVLPRDAPPHILLNACQALCNSGMQTMGSWLG